MIISVHSCSIDLFKVYSRKQEIKNTKKRKDIYKTVVCCCILLRCEGNWADTKHGEKIQSVEVSTVYSWECVPTECKVCRPASPPPPCSLCDDHYRLELQPVLVVTSHFTHRWWWGGRASEQLQQRQCPPPPLGSDWPQCRGWCWPLLTEPETGELCHTTATPALCTTSPGEPWTRAVVTILMEAIRWTHGDCFLVNVWTLYSVLWPLDYNWLTHKKSFPVTQNINRSV